MTACHDRTAAMPDGRPQTDDVDRIVEEWAHERPELDVSTVGVVSRIYRLDARFRQSTDRVFRRHGLSRGAFEALAALRRSGAADGLTQAELGRRLALSPGTVSVRVDGLVGDGLATRSAGRHDRRTVTVRLTESGRSLIDELAPIHLKNEQRLLRALSLDERAQLSDLLRKLVLDAGAADAPDAPSEAGRGHHTAHQDKEGSCASP